MSMDVEHWVIVGEERCGDIVPACWETDENGASTPVIYATQREAYLEIATLMQHRITTFFEDEDMDCLDHDESSAVRCDINEEGVITTEWGELFSPFKPQSDYGR